MVTYPGLPVPRLASVLSREASRANYAEGVEFFIGSIEMCSNTGTYLDTPFHRYCDGHDLAGLNLAACVELPIVFIDATGAVDAEHIPVDVSGAAVLIRTGWSDRWGTPGYLEKGHPYLSASGADALAAGGAGLVGIDALNIDSTIGTDRPAHSKLLAAGIPIVEHLTNLAAVPSHGARFTAVPPKVVGMGTFTVRAFARVPDRRAIAGVVIDCADVARLASFWSELLGGPMVVRSDDWATAGDHGVVLAFQRVPEAKTLKNRVHLDLRSDDLAADSARAVRLGATAIGGAVTDDVGSFQVLTDPEGNEFCFVH